MISDDDEAVPTSGWDSAIMPRPDRDPSCADRFRRRKVMALDDGSMLDGSRVEHEVTDAEPRSLTDAVVNFRAVRGSAKRQRNKQTPIQGSAKFCRDHVKRNKRTAQHATSRANTI